MKRKRPALKIKCRDSGLDKEINISRPAEVNMSDYYNEMEDGAKKAIEHFQNELAAIHTGRATTSLISDIVVDAYGQKMPLKQVANITVTDPRSMAVQPWDKGNLSQVENALREANLGLGIVNTGDNIRVNTPELTEERRNQYVKIAKEKAEDTKVTIRNIRRDVTEKIKKAKNAGEISEDEMYRREGEIQKLIEDKNKEIDAVFAAKEKELKEV